MKKCLVIHGSPRKGNTHKATMLVVESLSTYGSWSFEHVYLHDLKLPFCNGCFNCILRDEKYCPHNAITDRLHAMIQKSDALIVSAPIYILHVNAETKNFFDHFAYVFHRPRFFGKQALVITTTAAAAARRGTRFLKETLYQMGFNHAYELPITCWDAEFKPKNKDIKQISRVTKHFFHDVESNRIYPPSWYHLIYHSAFRAAAVAGTKERNADHVYWKEQDMIARTYPTRIGLFKQLVANLLFTLIKATLPKQ